MSTENSLNLSGTVLQGRYEILNKLGEGNFGQVYKARQRATNQEVAIKILRLLEGASAPAQEKQVARFQREMRLCSFLYHPNIVRLIDSGQMEQGLLYTVFEYAPGRNLGEVIADEGALNPAEVFHLMCQVLDALCCAHARGVVHRDLKPQGIDRVEKCAVLSAACRKRSGRTAVRSRLAARCTLAFSRAWR